MRHPYLLLTLATALIAAGCGDAAPPTASPPAGAPSFNLTDQPRPGVFELCKVGSWGDFHVEVVVNTPNGSTTNNWIEYLQDGECHVIHTDDGPPPDVVTVSEGVPEGFVLDHIEVLTVDENGNVTTTIESGPTVTGSVTEGKIGWIFIYHNIPTLQDPTPGRMTGGGNQIRIDGVRITRGLTLHCDITLSNNLEVNWTGGNKWHLDKPITSATCLDLPEFNPVPPPAPFDTFIGEAVGRLNGVDGSIIRFTFVDDGEPGTTDEAHIMIWAPGDDPDTDTPVLVVSGQLDGGNLQAHYDQPHN
jgi:hypothetical protein